MTRRWLPLVGGVLPPVPPYGDVDARGVIASWHPYLHCYCSQRLLVGDTLDGAGVLICPRCKVIVDERRVA